MNMVLKDKKAAKRLLKLAKKHPEWYTRQDVYYAKKVKKHIKQQKAHAKTSKKDIQKTLKI